MRTFSGYLLRETFAPLLLALAVALSALVLERMLRLIELTLHNRGAVTLIFKMLLNLVPFYLGIALPLAFFLAILLAFNRLSRNSELVALQSAGVSLMQVSAPLVALTVVFTILTGAIFGYLQPYGRYAYRALVYAVTHFSATSALSEGAFVQVGDTTLMAEQVSRDGRQLAKVFVHVADDDGRRDTITGRQGIINQPAENAPPEIRLIDGYWVRQESAEKEAEIVRFAELNRPIDPSRWSTVYRERGRDEEELTFGELWRARHDPPKGATAAQITAELHNKLVRTLSMLLLPLLAIPLSLAAPRARQHYGIAVGVIVLVVYYKVLELGMALVSLEYTSPWLGLWLPMAIFSAGVGHLFLRTSQSSANDPLTPLVEWLAATGDAVIARFKPDQSET